MSFGVPLTALLAAESQFERAHLEIEQPLPRKIIPLRFNPVEVSVKKTQNFAEIAIPGLNSPLIQWVRGGIEVLSFDATVDTTDTGENVHTAYVAAIRELLDFNAKLHAPPIIAFVWGHRRFRGVLDGLSTTYLLFDMHGEPLRAKLGISIKEYRSAKQQAQNDKFSPDVDKTYVVRRGDSLRSIAYSIYRDPANWRVLATANQIDDADDLEPGRRIRIPRLR